MAADQHVIPELDCEQVLNDVVETAMGARVALERLNTYLQLCGRKGPYDVDNIRNTVRVLMATWGGSMASLSTIEATLELLALGVDPVEGEITRH